MATASLLEVWPLTTLVLLGAGVVALSVAGQLYAPLLPIDPSTLKYGYITQGTVMALRETQLGLLLKPSLCADDTPRVRLKGPLLYRGGPRVQPADVAPWRRARSCAQTRSCAINEPCPEAAATTSGTRRRLSDDLTLSDATRARPRQRRRLSAAPYVFEAPAPRYYSPSTCNIAERDRRDIVKVLFEARNAGDGTGGVLSPMALRAMCRFELKIVAHRDWAKWCEKTSLRTYTGDASDASACVCTRPASVLSLLPRWQDRPDVANFACDSINVTAARTLRADLVACCALASAAWRDAVGVESSPPFPAACDRDALANSTRTFSFTLPNAERAQRCTFLWDVARLSAASRAASSSNPLVTGTVWGLDFPDTAIAGGTRVTRWEMKVRHSKKQLGAYVFIDELAAAQLLPTPTMAASAVQTTVAAPFGFDESGFLPPQRRLESVVDASWAVSGGRYEGKWLARVLVDDLILAIGSCVLVLIAVLFQTGSFFLTAVGITHVALTAPSAYTIYTVFVADGEEYFFPILNFLGVFVILGVGADDLFVYSDAWKQSFHVLPPATTSLRERIAWTHRRAATAMLITSITTAGAFLSNAFAPVCAVRLFAIYMAILVVVDYIYVITLFPAAIVVRHKCCVERGCCFGVAKRGSVRGAQCAVLRGSMRRAVPPGDGAIELAVVPGDNGDVRGVEEDAVAVEMKSAAYVIEEPSIYPRSQIRVVLAGGGADEENEEKSDDDGSDCDEVGAEKAALRRPPRWCEQGYCFYVATHRVCGRFCGWFALRVRWIAPPLLVLVASVLAWQASTIRAPSEPFTLWPTWHTMYRTPQLELKKFPEMDQRPITAYVVWGVEAVDGGGNRNRMDDPGALVVNDAFAIDDPRTQRYMLDLVDALLGRPDLAVTVGSSLREFDMWLKAGYVLGRSVGSRVANASANVGYRTGALDGGVAQVMTHAPYQTPCNDGRYGLRMGHRAVHSEYGACSWGLPQDTGFQSDRIEVFVDAPSPPVGALTADGWTRVYWCDGPAQRFSEWDMSVANVRSLATGATRIRVCLAASVGVGISDSITNGFARCVQSAAGSFPIDSLRRGLPFSHDFTVASATGELVKIFPGTGTRKGRAYAALKCAVFVDAVTGTAPALEQCKAACAASDACVQVTSSTSRCELCGALDLPLREVPRPSPLSGAEDSVSSSWINPNGALWPTGMQCGTTCAAAVWRWSAFPPICADAGTCAGRSTFDLLDAMAGRCAAQAKNIAGPDALGRPADKSAWAYTRGGQPFDRTFVCSDGRGLRERALRGEAFYRCVDEWLNDGGTRTRDFDPLMSPWVKGGVKGGVGSFSWYFTGTETDAERARIVASTVSVTTPLPRRDGRVTVLTRAYWERLEAFVREFARARPGAPAAAREAWQSEARYWGFIDLADAMIANAVTSTSVALALSALVLLLATGNARIALLAAASIAATIASVMAILVWLGWELNVMESMCMSILAGVSVDFVVHLGHAYNSTHGVLARDDDDLGIEEENEADAAEAGDAALHDGARRRLDVHLQSAEREHKAERETDGKTEGEADLAMGDAVGEAAGEAADEAVVDMDGSVDEAGAISEAGTASCAADEIISPPTASEHTVSPARGHSCRRAFAEKSARRGERARHALETIGFSVFSAGVTTALSASVLLLCTISFFSKFGTFLFIAMVASLFYSFAAFVPALALLGPAHGAPPAVDATHDNVPPLSRAKQCWAFATQWW